MLVLLYFLLRYENLSKNEPRHARRGETPFRRRKRMQRYEHPAERPSFPAKKIARKRKKRRKRREKPRFGKHMWQKTPLQVAKHTVTETQGTQKTTHQKHTRQDCVCGGVTSLRCPGGRVPGRHEISCAIFLMCTALVPNVERGGSPDAFR